MQRHYPSLPAQDRTLPPKGHVGIIGCGNFAFSNIAFYLHRNYKGAMRAAMDIDIHKAASLYKYYNLEYYTDNATEIILDNAIDLVYIASNHASHAEYAISVLKAGKNAHIEKPHVVSIDQLIRLCQTMQTSSGKVGLGFNRPNSRMGTLIKQYLNRETGTAMFNWFVAGHKIDLDHWYFKPEEGGRVLGNLCHWTDFILQLLSPENRYPITIIPNRSLKSDCDIAVTYIFGDGSIAAITFSAKGHTFEGVRERFSAHKGNVLISMDDFKNLTIEVTEKKYRFNPIFRDHGHAENIKNSYRMLENLSGCTIDYIWDTGMLFLKTKEALESNEKIMLNGFNQQDLESPL
jgi:predicted dehydrogenase